jgi:hypothetical protein
MAEIIGAVIERKRGDTAPDEITVPFDNTGFAYLLTINTAKDPEPVGPPIVGAVLVSSIGALTPGPTESTVSFPFSVANGNQAPGRYWYDIQQTDASGRIKTIAKNEYIFHMDVTK